MDKPDISDIISKSPKRTYKFRNSTKKKSKKVKKNCKQHLESDDDSDSDYVPDEDVLLVEDEEEEFEEEEEEEDEDEEEENTDSEEEEEEEDDDDDDEQSEKKEDFNAREFQHFIQKIFPSKGGKERLKQLEKIDEMLEKDKKVKKGKNKNTLNSRVKKKKVTGDNLKQDKKKSKKKKKRKKKRKKESSDEEYERALEAEIHKEETRMLREDLQDEDEEMDEAEIQDMLRQNMKFNIIFTVGQPGLEEDEEEEEETSEEEEEELKNNNETKLKSIDKKNPKNKKIKNLKKNQRVRVKQEGWDKYYTGKIVQVKDLRSNPHYSKYDIKLDEDEWDIQEDIKGKYIEVITKEEENDENTLKELKSLISCRKTKGKDAMIKQLDKMARAEERRVAKEQKKKDEKQQAKNVSTLRKLLRTPNVMNDFKYFKNMDILSQKKIIKQLKEVNQYAKVEKPYRLQLLDSDIPVRYQSTALKKINTLNYMDPGSGEYYKIKQWVDTFMTIPFGKITNLPLTMNDGLDKCNAFMENAKKQLDECVYGLDDAKMQILQLIGQWISNPNSIGTAIAIKGPPGTGKTTLIKEGISKILQRPFAFLALGGATDSSFLEGHSYTYEGSTWGKIVDILIHSKCMNPVIYFDELDKISDTPKGEEITGILTHLTDTTQNSCFHDKYFANMDFDISKALFIFSYNDEKKVNPILKDRMYRIHTAGYVSKEKIVIAKKYLIPKIEKNVNFKSEDITITDDALTKLIDTFTDSEKGVRNLKRCLEIIYTKLNLYRLMRPDSDLFEKESTIKVEFPFIVTADIINKLVKKGETNTVPYGMYI